MLIFKTKRAKGVLSNLLVLLIIFLRPHFLIVFVECGAFLNVDSRRSLDAVFASRFRGVSTE